ncbi:hypothetical protein [Streptomyces sp. t39]|uniref:hypothetical protein n=1 Tax=Streptomyces sp. t39 TaxID=1828156 RepID=UPI0011CDF39A|nr:hypothetical protein [Streptomyces sp. t39]TXS34849.1 hypothetical protein EAO77_38445 [Streptomyces sp. t39]
MYSLTPGYRVPALQRGLSPAETLLTKLTAGAGGAVLMSALVTPPPMWALGAVAGAAAMLNLSPGPRSAARWAAVGYRRLRERTIPASAVDRPGATMTWTFHPEHGTVQDPLRRAQFHDAFGRALTWAGSQARTAGIQVHVTHHAAVGEYTAHTQTISVYVPKGLGQTDRLLATLEGEFSRLGALIPVAVAPLPEVVERGQGWIGLDDGRFAATARITGWPAETDGDLMRRLLLEEGEAIRQAGTDRSIAVLYRPLPAAQSRRSARWQSAAAEAWTADKIKQDALQAASSTTHGALVQGATLVDLDAYLTVWGDTAETVTDARWTASLLADRHRIRLDWLPGQQHRAHVMTTPHGASTQKGTIL